MKRRQNKIYVVHPNLGVMSTKRCHIAATFILLRSYNLQQSCFHHFLMNLTGSHFRGNYNNVHEIKCRHYIYSYYHVHKRKANSQYTGKGATTNRSKTEHGPQQRLALIPTQWVEGQRKEYSLQIYSRTLESRLGVCSLKLEESKIHDMDRM